MGRGARGGGGLRAGPGADAWLRGVRFWRGLARIHSVNRELETVWPDGFQLRLTPTSASAAHENPCWHGFARIWATPALPLGFPSATGPRLGRGFATPGPGQTLLGSYGPRLGRQSTSRMRAKSTKIRSEC